MHWSNRVYVEKVFGWVRAIVGYDTRGPSHKGGARIVLFSNGEIGIDYVSNTCPMAEGPYTVRGAFQFGQLKRHYYRKFRVIVSGTERITCIEPRCHGPREINLSTRNSWMTIAIKTHYGLRP